MHGSDHDHAPTHVRLPEDMGLTFIGTGDYVGDDGVATIDFYRTDTGATIGFDGVTFFHLDVTDTENGLIVNGVLDTE